jgi:hypothetical protein
MQPKNFELLENPLGFSMGRASSSKNDKMMVGMFEKLGENLRKNG